MALTATDVNVATATKRRTRRRRNTLPLHLMLLPAVILTIIFKYGPMFGVIIAFQQFSPVKGIQRSPWIGLDNFRYALNLPTTERVIENTLIIALGKIILGLIAPLFVALMLNELRKNWTKRTVQTAVYLPHFLSWVILGGIMIEILSPSRGIVNDVLGTFGIGPIYFLGNNTWFQPTLILSHVWKEFGFNTVIYLAALTGIDPALYEAAMVDGASRIRQAVNITLPGLRPIIILLATLSLGSVLDAGFEQVLVLYSPQVYPTGDIVDTMVYRMGLIQAQYGVATAIGLAKSLVSLVLISLAYWMAYKFARYRIF
jgi:putative aldouronate transport system permease protein